MDAVEKAQLAIAYALETILAERTYALAWVVACSVGEVKEAVVAEPSEPGLGSNCPAGDWVPPDVFLQGFGSCVFDGEIVPCVSVPADRPRMGSATPVSHHRLFKTALIVFSAGVRGRIGADDGRGRGGGACSDSISRPCWPEPLVPTLPSPQTN